MQPLKDIYANEEIMHQIAIDLAKVANLKAEPIYLALIKNLQQLELKQRIERVADICHDFLPASYLKALEVLYKFCENKPNQLIYLFLPLFVAKFGKDHFHESLTAIRDFTQYSSSEEGVRTFLELNQPKTLKQMLVWTKSANVHIRRLASEGSRPRLPWAKKIQAFIEDPHLTWPILEALKEDKEKYVQKSVANHINDISKDHPAWLLKQLSNWDLQNPSTLWIVKHGLRTLIKNGNKDALRLFGQHQKPLVDLQILNSPSTIRLGESFQATFQIISKSKKNQNLMIDYKLLFQKKNGSCQAKTFKLKKITLDPQQVVDLKIRYTFKDLTTRKHYLGEHGWQLMINGEDFPSYRFDLIS